MISLNLFSGMAVGYMAMLHREIPVTKYYSCENNKYRNRAVEIMFPDAIQLGDILSWEEWDVNWCDVNIVTGGFPCQAWSIAGKQLGDKDERGKLFWVMLDIMKHVQQCNPNVMIIIENVKMKKDFEKYITKHTTEALGPVHKTLINSALVSGQNRNRYYWTNFPVVQPQDTGVMLSDILEDINCEGVIKNHGVWKSRPDKSMCIDANYHKGVDNHGQRTMLMLPRPEEIKNIKGVCALTERRTEEAKRIRRESMKNSGKELTPRTDGKMNCLTATYSLKEHTLVDEGNQYRKLTPREAMRLQTIPEHYIDMLIESEISNTQLYIMTGNAWTMLVMSHILKCMVDHLMHRLHLSDTTTLETDSGYFIVREINGPVYIWDNLIDAHVDLKEMGFDGEKVIQVADELLKLCNS